MNSGITSKHINILTFMFILNININIQLSLFRCD